MTDYNTFDIDVDIISNDTLIEKKENTLVIYQTNYSYFENYQYQDSAYESEYEDKNKNNNQLEPLEQFLDTDIEKCKRNIIIILEKHSQIRFNIVDSALKTLEENHNNKEKISKNVQDIIQIYNNYDAINKIKDSIDKKWSFEKYKELLQLSLTQHNSQI